MNPLVLFLATLLCTSAQAQQPDPAVAAEHSRLSSEMQRLAARETWDGVEALYRQLSDLQTDGAVLSTAEHLLGAQAARAHGDVAATLARLRSARAAGEAEQSPGWIADIQANYGLVVLSVPTRHREDFAVAAERLPFQSDQRFAIEHASESIAEEALFEGYLPVGRYTLGGTPFTVTTDQTTRIDLTGRRPAPTAPAPAPEPEPEPEPAMTRPPRAPRAPRSSSEGIVMGHIRLGVGLSGAGEPQVAGIEPVSFRGLSPGGALGASWHGASGLGGGAELGGMTAWSDDSRLSLGYLWAFGLWARDSLLVSVGPAVGGGGADLVGLHDAALQQYCATQPKIRCQGEEQLYSVGRADTSRLHGRIQATGGVLGANLTVAQTGAVNWSLGVNLGVLSDGVRAYSWAQVAVGARFGKGA